MDSSSPVIRDTPRSRQAFDRSRAGSVITPTGIRRLGSQPTLSTASPTKPDTDCAHTAVRVAIRVRPPLQPTDSGYDLIPPRFRSSTCQIVDSTHLAVHAAQGRKTFAFDHVFDQDTEQNAVWDYVADSVQSFTKGYNVSVMAYGQSGSGKSFTMGTSDPDGQQGHSRGIIQRAAEALFDKLDTADYENTLPRTSHRYSTLPPLVSESKKSWSLRASYVEIYHEQLRDLLVEDSLPPADRPQITIREDTKGRIFLSGLTTREVHKPSDLLDILEFGSKIRQTDATAVNAKSSRSHAIFTINLVLKDKSTASAPGQEKRFSVPVPKSSTADSQEIHSKLNFVDLAGSERLKHTGAQGERAKEGISINSGLASLGKVIAQLSARQPGHVSYRDSRLTRLLQDSLGGSAITYMLACVTPAEFHLTETLNTLHYAQRARAIQSKPEIHRLDAGDQDIRVERLQAEITLLREQIKNDSSGQQNPEDKSRGIRKAVELQEQLSDMQQKYNALNSRHVLLIEELGQQKFDVHPDTPMLEQIGSTAGERLQRSTSFAEAVEQVVSEYEKTIENLEGALGNARSSLSSCEGKLTDRDLKMASMQSNMQQMQARLRILTERDADNEAYLQRLESEVEQAASGEEKSSALMSGLRAELTRAKETNSGSEQYITALERRLADAEQDHAIMQRELDRLEQIVERQRSVGRLDGLVSDLETMARRDKARMLRSNDHSRDVSPSPAETEQPSTTATSYSQPSSPAHSRNHSMAKAAEKPSSTQFLSDKLESLTQELFDLRVEHETTVTNHDELSAKYRLALVALAKAEARPVDSSNGSENSDPFLGQSSSGEAEPRSQLPSRSRSCSPSSRSASASEASRSPPSRTILQVQTFDEPVPVPITPTLSLDPGELVQAHRDALAQIETLKKDLFRARVNAAPAPSPRKSPLLRRKPSQDVPIILNTSSTDRLNRSIASLRGIAAEHLSSTDLRQSFDTQLNQIMTDMHDRNEKLQESQVEMASIRKDLETKSTMLAGLTRERSSISTQVDFTVVGKMRDQLEQTEHQFRNLQQSSSATEMDLQARIKHLESQLANDFDNDTPLDMPGSFEQTPAANADTTVEEVQSQLVESRRLIASHEKELSDLRAQRDDSNEDLQAKLSQLEQALAVMTDKEQKSDRLVQELEEQLSSTFDQQQASTNRMSAVQYERQQQYEEAIKVKTELEKEMEEMRQRLAILEGHRHEERQAATTPTRFEGHGLGIEPLSPQRRVGRSASASSLNHRPVSPASIGPGAVAAAAALPSPPPDMPLPPIPGLTSPLMSPVNRGPSPMIGSPRPDSSQMPDANMVQALEERERRIRTVEKHLFAEKQLTATLEEALVDLETAQAKTRGELDSWRKRCTNLEDEMVGLRNERTNSRSSLQAVEEEREMRLKAERARNALEERMREFNANMAKKKKKSALNCFT